MPDPTDIELAELMLRQMTENLAFLQSQPDAEYAHLAYAAERIAYYSAKLFALTHQQISGASR